MTAAGAQEHCTDASWASAMPARPAEVPKLIRRCYTSGPYESHYVTMRDGIRIALDVMLPPPERYDLAAGVPCVLAQTRYMRGLWVRKPLSKHWQGRPMSLFDEEAKAYFLAAGYAVATIDVRGTGASGGQWRMPWGFDERKDTAQVLDWIVSQRWSDGQTVLWGVSYDATLAFFSIAEGHPAIRGAALLYPFWDLYGDISLPGGIVLSSFTRKWAETTLALDANDLGRLPWPARALKYATRGVQPVINADKSNKAARCATANGHGAHGVNGDAGEGGALPTVSPGRLRYSKAAQKAAFAECRAAIAEHDSWNAVEDLAHVRFTDDVAPVAGVRISQVSACSEAPRLAESRVPLHLVAGWLDATAAPAICAFRNATKAAGSELIIGPWGHGGLTNYSPQKQSKDGGRSSFPQSLHTLAFFDRVCEYNPAGRPAQEIGEALTAVKAAKRSVDGASAGEPTSAGLANGHATAAASDAMRDRYTDGGSAQSQPRNSGRLPLGQDEATAGADVLSGEPVHLYVMGDRPHWRAARSWPPEEAVRQTLYLAEPATHVEDAVNSIKVTRKRRSTGPEAAQPAHEAVKDMDPRQHGSLRLVAPGHVSRWRHDVDTSSFLKGTSRYEVITAPAKPIRYSALRGSGHALFTGAPLLAPLTVMGWPVVELWVASSDTDADLFVYLEDYDPKADKARYVTEGQFRASHRAELERPDANDARSAATLPGLPFHTFKRADAQPLTLQEPVRCRFKLLPTAFSFAEGHCVRLAVTGADSKHFAVDYTGPRSLWLYAGGGLASVLHLPEIDHLPTGRLKPS